MKQYRLRLALVLALAATAGGSATEIRGQQVDSSTLSDAESLERARTLLRRYQEHVARQTAMSNSRKASHSLDGELGALRRATISGTSAAAPTLAAAGLALDGDLHLGADSAVFKNDELVLWRDAAAANLALGHRALVSNTTGMNNTAIGVGALALNSTGAGNTGVGRSVLLYNSGGDDNTAFGEGTMRDNLTGSSNTALGLVALYRNTTGSRNTAVGRDALYANTTGNNNTAVGSVVLGDSNGSDNTGIGYRALDDNTSGTENVAAGFRSLYSSTTGQASVALGRRALYSHPASGRNTAAGSDALRYVTTGGFNAGLGAGAGSGLTSGNNNIFIGSGVSGGANESNTIRIGAGTGSANHQQNRAFIAGVRGVTTDQADATAVLIDSAGQLGTMSSARETKQDIRSIDSLSDRLAGLEPVAFRYRQHGAHDPQAPLEFGLIAEQVAQVFPELVVFDARGQPETVKYHLLPPLLLDRLHRLRAELTTQEEDLVRQQEQLARAAQRLEDLQQQPEQAQGDSQ